MRRRHISPTIAETLLRWRYPIPCLSDSTLRRLHGPLINRPRYRCTATTRAVAIPEARVRRRYTDSMGFRAFFGAIPVEHRSLSGIGGPFKKSGVGA
jgi:hypothetical protein